MSVILSSSKIFGRPKPVCEVFSSSSSDRSTGRGKDNRRRLSRGLLRAALFVLLAGCAPMAMRGATPTFVQVAYSTPQTPEATVSVAYPSAQTAGDLNVVVVGWNDTTATVSSVKDSAGNVYRLAIGPTLGSGLSQSIYYASGIAGGSNTVTVTFSQAAVYPDVRVLEYEGAASLDVTAGKSGSSASASSGAATTTGTNELVVGANTVATGFGAVGSGYTERVVTEPDSDLVEDKTATTAASNNAKATLNESGAWVMQMAAFAAGTASAPTAALSAVSCSSSSLTGAATDACTVTLTAAAPSSGMTVSLASSSSAVAVPASVTVASGATSASFTATASAVTTAQSVTLTATASGVSKTFAIELNAASPALSVSTTSVAFGNVTVSDPATETVTLTSSGTSALTVSGVTVSGTGFSESGVSTPVTLNPGSTATLTVEFDPTTAGSATGTVTVSDNASPATASISLSGTGTATAALSGITCSSSSLTGATTDACTVTLTSTAPSGGFGVALESSSSSVTVPASVTVASGATSASFTATASAVTTAQTATLTASASGVSKTFAIQLNAATPSLTLSTTSVAFGNVDLNTPSTQTVTLTSSGTAAVTVSAVGASGAGFSVSGVTTPLTLNPGNTATLDVEFDPTTSGSASGTATVTNNGSGGTATVVLTGTGQAASYEVELSWDAPSGSSDPVSGYDVYRSVSGSTSYQMVNPSLCTGTSFTDTSVTDGTSYVYYVVSVDSEGNQSTPSNTYTASIP